MTNNGVFKSGRHTTTYGTTKFESKYLAVLFGIWLKYGSSIKYDKNQNHIVKNISNVPFSLIFDFVQTDEEIKNDVDIAKLEIESGSEGRATLSPNEQKNLYNKLKNNPEWTLADKFANLIRGMRRLISHLNGDPEADVIYTDRRLELVLPSKYIFELIDIDLTTIPQSQLPLWVYEMDGEIANVLIDTLDDNLKSPDVNGVIGSEAFNGLIAKPIPNKDSLIERLLLHSGLQLDDNLIKINPKGFKVINDWTEDVYCCHY